MNAKDYKYAQDPFETNQLGFFCPTKRALASEFDSVADNTSRNYIAAQMAGKPKNESARSPCFTMCLGCESHQSGSHMQVQGPAQESSLFHSSQKSNLPSVIYQQCIINNFPRPEHQWLIADYSAGPAGHATPLNGTVLNHNYLHFEKVGGIYASPSFKKLLDYSPDEGAASFVSPGPLSRKTPTPAKSSTAKVPRRTPPSGKRFNASKPTTVKAWKAKNLQKKRCN